MKTKNKTIKELADLIERNPKCKFRIDNDQWSITLPVESEDDDPELLADSDDYYTDTDWYSGGNLYGAGLAEAMVELLNRRGFQIEAEAV